MSVGSSRPRSVFYCNPTAALCGAIASGSNEMPKAKCWDIPRSSLDEKSEGHCKASFTNQGFRYEGTIFVTKFRVVFVCDDDKADSDSISQDERGSVLSSRRNTNCGQKMSAFYDEYLDIPLTQIRRVFIVQQEPGATSQSVSSNNGSSAISGSPTKPNLKWLPFPSQFEPLMDFLYIQIECSTFNCCTIYFEKSQTSYQQFLNSLASRLKHTTPRNFLFMNVSENLNPAELSSSTEMESHKSFVFLKDWISFFQNSFLVNILKDEDKIGRHGNICSIIASAILLQLYSKKFSIADNPSFLQFCLSIKHENQRDKFLMRYFENVPSSPMEFTGRSSFILPKNSLKSFLSQNKDTFDIMEVTEQLTFSAKALSQGYELLEEYLLFRFGRSRKFFKLSIKLFRTVFETSGWLHAVSNCLKCASVIGQKFQSSYKDIFILKNSAGLSFGISCILTSLVEVLLSPQCRTTAGFIEVVQRHWIAAGFDFKQQFTCFTDKKPKCLKRFLEDKKSSIASSKRMTKNLLKFGTIINPGDEQALMSRTPTPYFLVFLDCVHQLTRLYPTYFEFNSPYLSQIWNFLLSGVFPDFLDPKVQSIRPSLWECIDESPNAHLFRNPFFLEDFMGDDMKPQLDAKMYDCANLEIWDDMFFRYHIDCTTVIMSVDDKSNSKFVLPSTREYFLKPPPNSLERNTSFDSSLEHVYELMDAIKIRMAEDEAEDQSDWIQPKRSFHSDVNPKSFTRVASSIEILDVLDSGDEEEMADVSTSQNPETAADRSSSRESTLSQDWGKFSLGGDSRGPSIRSTGDNHSTDDVDGETESSTELLKPTELVTIKSTKL